MLDTIRKYFNLKILLSAVLLALVAFAIFIALMIGSKPKQRLPGSVTAIVNVVPAPTWTQAFPTATQAPTATAAPGSSQTPGEIVLGAYVEVIGTGGSGLRLRVDPDLQAEVRLLGGENEIFVVKDGPQEAGGYTWWYLVGPSDESRRGWAVADFLSVAQNP
jgi:hypothetical protein